MDAATKEPLTFNFTAVTELWTAKILDLSSLHPVE